MPLAASKAAVASIEQTGNVAPAAYRAHARMLRQTAPPTSPASPRQLEGAEPPAFAEHTTLGGSRRGGSA